MSTYTKTFEKPYPNGYEDLPSENTPIGHEIIESWEKAISSLESYLNQNSIQNTMINTAFTTGTRVATIMLDEVNYIIYAPEVSYTSAITGGAKVGTLTVGNNEFSVYAPTSSAGGSDVSVTPKTTEGTNIAEITIDGTTYQLYAPAGGSGSGSTVTAEALLAEGTAIGKITIDGVETTLYAPKAASVTVDAELSADSENPIQNKAVDAAVKNLQKQIDAGGSGGSVTVDDALSSTSENPVQNKVITEALTNKVETADTEESPDFVNFDLDTELSETSTKGVQNKAIYAEFKAYADGTKTVEKANKATQDGDGNNIADTYMKKGDVPGAETMSDTKNGVGRPDGNGITVDKNGVFGLYNETYLGDEFMLNSDFNMNIESYPVKIGRTIHYEFFINTDIAISNYDDVLICQIKKGDGESRIAPLYCKEIPILIYGKTGLYAYIQIPGKIVYTKEGDYDVVEIYICKSEPVINLSTTNLQYIIGKADWITIN